MKSIITESVIVIEAKYVNAKPQPNYLHILICSNEDWVVPIGQDARRFQMIQVSDKYQDDRNYFNVLGSEIKNGGLEAMVYDLLRFDLSNYNVRDIKITDAFVEQQIRSLQGFYAWLYEYISKGENNKHIRRKGNDNDWAEWAETQELYDGNKIWCADKHANWVDTKSVFGKNMKKFFKSTKLRFNGQRKTGYHLGTLVQARKVLEKIVKKV